MNIELNFPPNSEGLVPGCIDADFCMQIGNTHLEALAEIYTIELDDIGRTSLNL